MINKINFEFGAHLFKFNLETLFKELLLTRKRTCNGMAKRAVLMPCRGAITKNKTKTNYIKKTQFIILYHNKVGVTQLQLP